MVASSATGSKCVLAPNDEVTCIRLAQLRKPENNTKFNWLLNVFSYISRKWVSVVKFGTFGDTKKSNLKQIGCSRPEKSELEKCWFGSKQNNSTV